MPLAGTPGLHLQHWYSLIPVNEAPKGAGYDGFQINIGDKDHDQFAAIHGRRSPPL